MTTKHQRIGSKTSRRLWQYIKSLNKNASLGLVYGWKYEIWRDGEYLGVATWTKDKEFGDSFQSSEFDYDSGCIVQMVYSANAWKLKRPDTDNN